MFNDLIIVVKRLIVRFRHDSEGVIAPIVALSLIPVMTAVGATVDYSRANNIRSKLQSALDTALLAGARENTSNWNQTAANVFEANLKATTKESFQVSKHFVQETGQLFRATATAAVPTAFLGLINISSLKVAVAATATASEPDNSCILTLDHGQSPSHVSLSLNGAPIVNLSGCSIRSNTSIDCNGHDGSVTKAVASGQAAGCGTPKPYSTPVPDIYAQLATKILLQCGTSRPGATWTPGVMPSGPGVLTITNYGRTEYHICGDLTLSGSGTLPGNAPGSDALIVIENGSLNIENNASISVARTAIIMTGDNNFSSKVNFPMGAGKQASLTLSPPIDADNPWQGVALYLDPKLTKDVDNKWGPGANFSADGLVYLGKSNVVTDGNTSSSNAKCSKFVMNQFTTNGHVNLDFNQTVASCAAIGLKQWGGIVVYLIK
jgi:Flp pilus assembly protein TadG